MQMIARRMYTSIKCKQRGCMKRIENSANDECPIKYDSLQQAAHFLP